MRESARHLSVVETAKLMRVALKAAFPATKFSVKSDSYAGGASIRVGWTDGPTVKRVTEISGQFQGGGFDGSIDMKYHVDHWLLPDGSTVPAYSPGTEGSRGYVPGINRNRPHDDAELVSFGADFVFEERKISTEFARKLVAQVAAWAGVEAPAVEDRTWTWKGKTEVTGWKFVEERLYDKPLTEGFGTNGGHVHWSWGCCVRRAAEDATEFSREVTA